MRSRFGMLLAGAALYAVPIALLAGLGAYHAWQRGYLLIFMAGASLLYLTAWILWRKASTPERLERIIAPENRIGAEPFWSEFDLAVWKKVEGFADLVETGARPVESYDQLLAVMKDLLEMVAKEYHPYSDEARLEVKLSQVLIVTEQACRDLRQLFIENVPLQNMVTINEMLKARKTFNFMSRAYDFYRALRPFANPGSALVSELRLLASGKAVEQVSKNTTNWILARVAEGGGKHLINLYSGQVYDAAGLSASIRAGEEKQGPELGAGAALKILVLGQVNAGKSSLINALFGEVRSLSHHLPETQGFLHFEKEIEGVGKARLIDSPGYGEGGEAGQILAKVREHMRDVDMIILVTPANQAAREADVELARSLKRWREEDPKACPPPFVVVASKIDLLRPLQNWNPPYNLSDPAKHTHPDDRRKAENIRDCVLTIAKDFGLDSEEVIPIYTGSVEEAYNIDELVVVLGSKLPGARTALLRRLLKEYHDDQYWEELRSSLKRSGKLIVKSGLESAIKGLRAISDVIGKAEGRK